MASSWTSESWRHQPDESLAAPRLSSSMVQSVKLRASGSDTYLQPTTLATKFDRVQLRSIGYEAQTSPQSVNSDNDPSGWTHHTTSYSTLPSLSAPTVPGEVNVGGSLTSFLRLGGNAAAGQGRRHSASSLHTPLSPHSTVTPNAETRQVSPAATSSLHCPNSTGNNMLRPQDSSARAVATIQLVSAAAASTTGSVASATSSTTAPPTKKRVRIKTERRREQCRANQARYRNKQRALRQEFHEAVDRLRGEVEELEAQKRALTSNLHTKKSAWNVVVDYFRLFQYGASVCNHAGASLVAHCRVRDLYAETSAGKEQLAFLHSVVSPDVNLVGNASNGVDALAEQWIVWTTSCSAFEMTLKSVERVPGQPDTLVASAIVTMIFSDSTLTSVFPNLAVAQDQSNSEDGGQLSDGELTAKLYGRRLEFECATWFECDPLTSQVLRLRSQLDIIPPLLRALGSLQDVARVLDGARLTTDSFGS